MNKWRIQLQLCCLVLFIVGIVHNTTAQKDHYKASVPKLGWDYDAGIPYAPKYNDFLITDTSYCGAYNIRDFDVSNPIDGQGIALFLNKYNEQLYIKNANWINGGKQNNKYWRRIEKGHAELLLMRKGESYYHAGNTFTSVVAFGWNIYTRPDGKFEYGLVGGNRAIYPLEVLPYSTNDSDRVAKNYIHNGDSTIYWGQWKNNQPDGFGMILTKKNVMIDYGFWENGKALASDSLLRRLAIKHGIKTQIMKGKGVSYINKKPNKYRKVTGFFNVSKEHKSPYGWFVADWDNETMMTAFAGYYPDEFYPKSGYLKSSKQCYGLYLRTIKYLNNDKVDPENLSAVEWKRVPFKTSVNKTYDYGYLHWNYSNYSDKWGNASSVVPALSHFMMSREVWLAQEEEKRLRQEEYAKHVKGVYLASRIKPGQFVKNGDTYYYVNGINSKDSCLILVSLPFTNAFNIFAYRDIMVGKNMVANRLRPRHRADLDNQEVHTTCNQDQYQVMDLVPCSKCHCGGKESYSTTKENTTYSSESKKVYRHDGTYVYTYNVPNYSTKKMYHTRACSVCKGYGVLYR